MGDNKMTNLQLQIIDLLQADITVDKLMEKLQLTPSQLLYQLNFIKRQGYQIMRTFYENGSQRWRLSNNVNDIPTSNEVEIKGLNGVFHFLAFSDTHIGHKKQKLEWLPLLVNYGKENGIHTIIHAGDLYEGFYHDRAHLNQTAEQQVMTFLKAYPYEPGINTFLVAGNHDENLLRNHYINIVGRLENSRIDLRVLGYQEGFLRIGNSRLKIKHQAHAGTPDDRALDKIILQGHSHQCTICQKQNALLLKVPTLSEVTSGENRDYNIHTGALDVKVKLDNTKKVDSVEIQQLSVQEKLTPINKIKIKVE